VFDPSDREHVEQAFVAALRSHHPLAHLARPPVAITSATSTWVWFVDLAGVNLPVAWQGPLVLRIFRRGLETVAEREDRLSTFLTTQGYPAPATHLRGELGQPSHPFVLQQRLPGRPAIELIKSYRVRAVIAGLGDLQGQLHRLSTTNFPLRRLTAAVYLEHDLAPRREQLSTADPEDWLAWLRSTAPEHEAVSDEDIVVCHGDFHLLNAVADTSDGLRLGIVDWTDACLGDRHLDVGRSVALYWYGSIVASAAIERRLFRMARGTMVRTHLRRYRSTTGVRLDKQRLDWWQIVHLYRGWLQLSVSAEGLDDGPESSTTDRFASPLRDELLDRCRALRKQLGR
jgi:aminoglycoside phosphotransferase (APT) family kinase protein